MWVCSPQIRGPIFTLLARFAHLKEKAPSEILIKQAAEAEHCVSKCIRKAAFVIQFPTSSKCGVFPCSSQRCRILIGKCYSPLEIDRTNKYCYLS